MTATRLDLVSERTLAAPPSRIWAVVSAPDEWPQWWRAVKRVEVIEAGDAQGIGAVRRFSWSTALPYTVNLR